MAGQVVSFEDEDVFRFIDWDQAEQVDQLGAWRFEEGAVAANEEHAQVVRTSHWPLLPAQRTY